MQRKGVRGGLAAVAPAVMLVACSPPVPAIDAEAHEAEVEAWRQERYATLTEPAGWLSLVGLFWIDGLSHTFGADASNDFVYARDGGGVPERIGTFSVEGSDVRFEPAAGVSVQHGDTLLAGAMLITAGEDDTPIDLELNGLRWRVIRRGDRLAVRVWDALSPVRTGFDSIPMFEVSQRWRLAGRFEWKDPPDTIDIPSILGTVNATPSPAAVSFEIDGRDYRLDLWKDSDDPANFFTAFADETNGIETYGGGRFLWIDAPDERGWTVVDFNRSYNPPCAFTGFSTCPLPPPQNKLPLRVDGGEQTYGAAYGAPQ